MKPPVIKLLGDNRSDAPYQGRFGPIPGAELSGGNWPVALANLQDPELGLVAQSLSADPADTRFTVNFTGIVSMRAFWLANTNLSIYSRIRLTGFADLARTQRTIERTFDVYPLVAYTRDLPWGSPNWFSGKPLPENLEGFTPNAFTVFPDPVYARVLDVEILDPSNPDGFVQLGRLYCMDGWVPSQNYSRGGALGLESGTTNEATMSGSKVFDVRQPARVLAIAFNNLPAQEALDKGFELVRRAAIQPSGGEILVIDDASPINLHRLSFVAWAKPITKWERPSSLLGNNAFELEERLP